MDDKTAKQFERWGKNPPSHTPHGLPDDIRASLQRLQPRNWRLEGNKLIGMTDMGPLVQYIPTNVICLGSDEKGLPILEKIKL